MSTEGDPGVGRAGAWLLLALTWLTSAGDFLAGSTAKFGPTSASEQEAVEERREQRQERLEKRRELLEERREGAVEKVARDAHPATFARGNCLTTTPGNDSCLTDS